MKGHLQAFIVTALIAVLTTVISVTAADNGEPQRDAVVDGRSGVQKTYRQLSRVVDLWHDAVLKGENKQAAEFEHSLKTILWADLEAHRYLLRRAAREAALTASAKATDSTAAKTHGGTFRELKSLLRAKERLLQSFQRSPAFSNRYRLVGNYLELIRRQLGQQQTWLAERPVENRQP